MASQKQIPRSRPAKSTGASRRASGKGDTDDLTKLVKFALLNPKSPQGKAALESAEAAYLRLGRRLRQQAEKLSPALADELDKQANAAYFRATALRQLGRLREVVIAARKGPLVRRPAAPTKLAVIPGRGSATVRWSAPKQPVTEYTITVSGYKAPPPQTVLPPFPAPLSAVITGLTNGKRYTFRVRAGNLSGNSPFSASTPAIIPTDLLGPPAPPTNLIATPANASALLVWTPPPQALTNYIVTTSGPSAPPPLTLPGAANFALITGLVNGQTYTATVRAVNVLGQAEALSEGFTPLAPILSNPFAPTLPPLSSDPALLIDPLGEIPFRDTVHNIIETAGVTGATWRFEYLLRQALQASRDALQFEQQIATLMQMAIAKVSTAELLLNPVLIEVDRRQKEINFGIALAGASPQIDELLEPLAKAAAENLLLPRFIDFLVRTNPLGFWVGLFEALIGDLASAFFSDTDFSRARGFLNRAFQNDVDGIKSALQRAVAEILGQLDSEVEQMIAPLKEAVAEVVKGTKEAMEAIFEGFDGPLLMNPPKVAGGADIPNVDPFEDLQATLENTIQKVADQISSEIASRLSALTSGNSDLFLAIAITYLVLPILAFLVISLAGGPFSAAILAAAVLLAAEQLVHLLLRWLTGPLTDKVDEARQLAEELVGRLQRLFAENAELVRAQSPAQLLKILSNELRELKNLVPTVFLNESAELLMEARDVILRTALQLSLGAEQALGFEHATAFDAVSQRYETFLAPAPQLPGGADPARLSSAALIRDLGRLEQQRTALLDGKEFEFKQKLSLFRLLGGVPGGQPGQFASLFKTTGEAVIRLTEEELIDRTFPGIYRVLIKDIRVTGLFASAVAAVPGSAVQLFITHLGESRTRIKRNANPAAPPLELPDCVDLTLAQFVKAVAGREPLEAFVRAAFESVPPRNSFLIGLELFHPNIFRMSGLDPIGREYQRATLGLVPGMVARKAESLLCGFVDAEGLRQATEAILRDLRYSWETTIPLLLFANNNVPALKSQIELIVSILRFGPELELDPGVLPLLTPEFSPFTTTFRTVPNAAGRAYQAALDAFAQRVGKWGGASLVEDPDPHVRSLGFATLLRPMQPETTVFNLFPNAPVSAVRSEPPAETATAGAVSTLQYRPFENRGIEGGLLLRLAGGTLPPGAPSLIQQLEDIVVEITLRACYDADLAATLRASQQRTVSNLDLTALLGGITAVPRFILPGERPRVDVGASELRTIHLSLRAIRDTSFQAWTVAAQLIARPPAGPDPLATIRALLPALRPLQRDDPFTPLAPVSAGQLPVRLSFERQALPANPTQADLLELPSQIRISPAVLGFADAVLNSTSLVLQTAQLVSLGIAVVPTKDGAGTDAIPDPLGIQLRVTSPLERLFPADAVPGANTTVPLTTRLLMTLTAAAQPQPVLLADLFGATGTAPSLELALPANLFGETKLLYDVIFSMSYRVPVIETATSLAALR